MCGPQCGEKIARRMMHGAPPRDTLIQSGCAIRSLVFEFFKLVVSLVLPVIVVKFVVLIVVKFVVALIFQRIVARTEVWLVE
jgi:hypothetical protein